MAKLRDAAQIADEIKGRLDELKAELSDGKGDFEKLVQLSDEISEQADGLAEMFGNMNEVLMSRISGKSSSSASGQSSSGGSQKRQKSGSRS